MHDAFGVQVDQSLYDLLHEDSYRPLRQPLRAYFLVELPSRCQLQDQDVLVAVIIDFVELDDVGVVELPHDCELL